MLSPEERSCMKGVRSACRQTGMRQSGRSCDVTNELTVCSQIILPGPVANEELEEVA